jgi:hypothetical protein
MSLAPFSTVAQELYSDYIQEIQKFTNFFGALMKKPLIFGKIVIRGLTGKPVMVQCQFADDHFEESLDENTLRSLANYGIACSSNDDMIYVIAKSKRILQAYYFGLLDSFTVGLAKPQIDRLLHTQN